MRNRLFTFDAPTEGMDIYTSGAALTVAQSQAPVAMALEPSPIEMREWACELPAREVSLFVRD